MAAYTKANRTTCTVAKPAREQARHKQETLGLPQTRGKAASLRFLASKGLN